MCEIIPWFILVLSTSSITQSDNLINNGVLIAEINPELPKNVTINYEEGVILVTSPAAAEENDVHDANVVSTKYGDVRGYEIKETNIRQFLDIPYAAFDAADPFQDPTEPEKWESIREITKHSSWCPQLDIDESYIGTFDCLTLSVLLPNEARNVDVLFHIHDGDFTYGSADPQLYGAGYLVPKGVILVLPNYRLGSLGFLCRQDSIAPGNAALKDLTMALIWTRENIEVFGGNPSNIVVSGSGSGAILAEYLALSPQSQKYVSKVITESGSILSHWAIDRTPLQTATNLDDKLSATESDNSMRGNILYNFTIEEIVTAAKGLIFRPCIDHEFLNVSPWNLLVEQKFKQSFMIGATDRPGLHKAMQHTEQSIAALNQDFGLLLPNDLLFEESKEEIETGKRVKTQYFGNDIITLDHRNELSLCYTDCLYLSPGIRTARLLSAGDAKVFVYEFSFVASVENKRTNAINGAAEGDSLNYVFQRDGHIPAEDSIEYKMINLMTDLWINFIHAGNPTTDGVEWHQYEETKESEELWLSIGTSTEMKKGFHVDRLSLWTEIYNEHFIDHSSALRTKPGTSAWIIVLVGYVKNLWI